MPGAGAHRFYFDGKPPIVFGVLVILLFANTVSSLALAFLGKYIFSRPSTSLSACPELTTSTVPLHVPPIICRYANWDIAIQFILLGLLALTMVIFRKRVRYVNRGRPFS
jgi:hypothetical protein